MPQPAELGPDTRIVATRRQASCKLAEGEVVILEMSSGVYFGLGSVGARIWELLQEPSTAQGIQSALLAEFDVGPEACLQDTLALLEELRRAGLVQLVDEPTQARGAGETANAGLTGLAGR